MTRDDDLIAKYIEPNPNRPGADEVRLAPYGQSVWAIIGDYRVVEGDVQEVAADYDLPVEAVEAALAYYRRHKDIIDNRLAANMA
jgi:uncharacterized protein (DUF433 family)